MIRFMGVAATVIALFVAGDEAWARGGARGGGGRGGGFGGGISRGGYGGRGFGGGGYGAGSFGGSRGGYGRGTDFGVRPQGNFAGGSDFGRRGENFGGGNFGGAERGFEGGRAAFGGEGQFSRNGAAGAGFPEGSGASSLGAAPSRSQMNQFLGLPSDGGMQSMARTGSGDNFDVNRGMVEGRRGGVAGGAAVTGPNGNTVGRGAAVGPNGGVAAGRAAVGAGGGGVARGVAAGPGGRVAAGGIARGPEGGVAARGIAAGPGGAIAGFGYASPSARYGRAYAVRARFAGYGLYTPGWYAANRGVWLAAGLTTAAWQAATWDSAYAWCGAAATPVDYNYGSNVVAQDGDVYIDGQPAGTTQEYYQQAAGIAQSGARAPSSAAGEWLPLGVFAMTHGEEATSTMAIQLAVDKQGIIRGNFTDTTTNKTLPVQGSIDKQTQRAAWTIGDKKDEVMETGLYNLTQAEVTALLHYGSERTEQWLLVRVEPPASAQK